MKLLIILFPTIFTLIYSSPISVPQSPTFLTNLSQSLYLNLNSIFQDTLEQLKCSVQEYANLHAHRASRQVPPRPAEWFTQMFDGSHSISAQWNSHVTDFFANIPTVFEKEERSLFDSLSINKKLHSTVKILLKKLKKTFDDEISKQNSSKSNDISSDKLYQDLQSKVSQIFAQTEIELNQTIDDLIRNIFSFMNKFEG